MAHNMMEYGRHFSDDTYACKEEVQAVYNQSNVDEIWKSILSYRSFYDAETELRDTSSLPYKICLTRKISSFSYNLQTKLNHDLVKFILLPEGLKKEYILQKEIKALLHTAKANNSSVSENTLRKLAQGEIENIPSDLFVLKAYLESYREASKMTSLTLEDIIRINQLCSGEEDSKQEVKYRLQPSDDIINPLKEPSSIEIKEHLEHLLAFLKQEDIPLLLRALSIPYVFMYLRPFEYYNEETSALLAKAFLSMNGLGIIGYTLNLESISYANSKSFFDRLKLVETSLDLTYALERFLAFIIKDEENISSVLKEFTIKKEEMNNDTLSPLERDSDHRDIAVVDAPSQFALPAFPRKDSYETIEARARQLREVHPQLKKKQAHFYAGHCTIGLHYTIEQFKAEEHTVYETARTSMEDLANRGFYKKEMIGKKFVYTPIPLQDQD